MLSCLIFPLKLFYLPNRTRAAGRPSVNCESDRWFCTLGKQATRAAPNVIPLVLITALLTACGTFGPSDEDQLAPGEVTPTSRNVYINNPYIYVRLTEAKGAAGSNDHPVNVAAAQVRAWLAGIKVEPEDSDEPIPLIPADTLPQLSVLVAQALGDARPDQDVIFHTFRKVGSWFGSTRRDTTARVFYRDGALNLIFGDLDDFYSEQIDRDLQPLTPGYRNTRSDFSGKLIDSPEFTYVGNRPDWIRINTSAIAEAKRKTPRPALVAPVPTAQTNQDPRWTQLQERLLILEGLREKGLITQKDYEVKKRELLEVLDL
jgi:hypothetical protein